MGSAVYANRVRGGRELARVVVGTTVQPKNLTFPTGVKLTHKAIIMLVRLSRARQVRSLQSRDSLITTFAAQHNYSGPTGLPEIHRRQYWSSR